MALGKRNPLQQTSLIPSTALPKSPGHCFYEKLQQLLSDLGFDAFVEDLCAPYYSDSKGRPSIAPGVYFRILLIGYFEDLGSQREMAWRISDSFSLREFLGIPVTERTPDHSSLTRIRQRLPVSVYEAVFRKVLGYAKKKKLLKGKSIGIDSTTLEANAAMRSIVRKDTGEDWQEYVSRVADEEGVEIEDDDDQRRFDRGRKGRKTSNKDWESKTDPDSRIMRMKDRTTRLGYKLENAVDLETEMIVTSRVLPGDEADTRSLQETVFEAGDVLGSAGAPYLVTEVVADKGYHSLDNLDDLSELEIRTYLPARKQKGRRKWAGKPSHLQSVYRKSQRRVTGTHGRMLQRLRSCIVERVFAHLVTTGGGRRTRIRGRQENQKVWSARALAHNLGRLMRSALGAGSPKGAMPEWLCGLAKSLNAYLDRIRMRYRSKRQQKWRCRFIRADPHSMAWVRASSTGC